MFRHLNPSCFAYSTNYTQDLLAIDKINLGTMKDPMPLLPSEFYDSENFPCFPCAVKQHRQDV